MLQADNSRTSSLTLEKQFNPHSPLTCSFWLVTSCHHYLYSIFSCFQLPWIYTAFVQPMLRRARPLQMTGLSFQMRRLFQLIQVTRKPSPLMQELTRSPKVHLILFSPVQNQRTKGLCLSVRIPTLSFQNLAPRHLMA